MNEHLNNLKESEVIAMAKAQNKKQQVIVNNQDTEEVSQDTTDVTVEPVMNEETNTSKVEKEPEVKKPEVENLADVKVEPVMNEETNTSKVEKEPEVKKPEVEEPVLKIGAKVRLDENVTSSVTGARIPSYAHRGTYEVSKILNDRVIIKSGVLYLAVKANDIKLV